MLLGALIGVLVTAFAGESQRRFVFDSWQRQAPRAIATERVAVVMIDNDSIAKYGEWPWSRYRMAQLINAIGAAEPAVIGIDIYFTDPNPMRPEAFTSFFTDQELDPATRARIMALPDFDQDLAAVLGAYPTVMARVAIEGSGVAASELFYTEVAGTPPPGLLHRENVLASIPELDGAAYSQAFVNASPDDDGLQRRVPLAVRAGDVTAPGFAVELARIASGADAFEWQDGELMMGDTAIPAGSPFRIRSRSSSPRAHRPRPGTTAWPSAA